MSYRENWSFTWSRGSRKKLEVEVQLCPTTEDYLSISDSKKHQDSLACFYSYKGKGGRTVGRIQLDRTQPDLREHIIHEAIHAAFETQRQLGRSVPDRYEEAIVSCAAGLADEMLSCILDHSI